MPGRRSAPRPARISWRAPVRASSPRHPELFGPEVFGTADALEGNLERLLVEMPRLDPKLRALSERMPGEIDRSARRFGEEFPELRWAGPAALSLSFGQFEAVWRTVSGKRTLVLGLDSIAFYRGPYAPVDPLIHHALASALLPGVDGTWPGAAVVDGVGGGVPAGRRPHARPGVSDADLRLPAEGQDPAYTSALARRVRGALDSTRASDRRAVTGPGQWLALRVARQSWLGVHSTTRHGWRARAARGRAGRPRCRTRRFAAREAARQLDACRGLNDPAVARGRPLAGHLTVRADTRDVAATTGRRSSRLGALGTAVLTPLPRRGRVSRRRGQRRDVTLALHLPRHVGRPADDPPEPVRPGGEGGRGPPALRLRRGQPAADDPLRHGLLGGRGLLHPLPRRPLPGNHRLPAHPGDDGTRGEARAPRPAPGPAAAEPGGSSRGGPARVSAGHPRAQGRRPDPAPRLLGARGGRAAPHQRARLRAGGGRARRPLQPRPGACARRARGPRLRTAAARRVGGRAGREDGVARRT